MQNKQIMKTKQELLKELAKIEKQELKELINREYPKFKKLEGACYKIRNSYGARNDRESDWFLYIKVCKINKSDLYRGANGILAYFTGVSFQTDNNNQATINFKERTYLHLYTDSQKITEEHFNRELDKLKARINKLNS